MKYFEINFPNEWSICIKGLREPTITEANEFCLKDVEKFGSIESVYLIERSEAIHFYDFDNENNWPVFGI